MSNLKVEREKHGGSVGQRKNEASSSKNGYIKKRLEERRANRGADSIIEWGNADGNAVLAIIDRLVGAGCTVTFAATRDGNALRFSLYDGVEKVDEYCRATESIETFIAMLLEIYAVD